MSTTHLVDLAPGRAGEQSTYGARYKAIQNLSSLDVDHRFTVNFKLKGPAGD